MVTTLNNRTTGREAGYEMIQYISARLAFATTAAASLQRIGSIPAGAVITSIISKVITVFAGGTPAISVGSNGPAYNNLVATVAIAVGSESLLPIGAFPQPLAVDTEFWASVGGGIQTTGDSVIIIQFIKPLC